MAQDEFGEDFDLRGFHIVVLGNDCLPLEMLERFERAYFEAEKAY